MSANAPEPGCESARGPDADRRANPLIPQASEGQCFAAYLQAPAGRLLCCRHLILLFDSVLWQRRKGFTGSLQERFELCQFESSCWLAEFLRIERQ
jgi:hypothetical protein